MPEELLSLENLFRSETISDENGNKIPKYTEFTEEHMPKKNYKGEPLTKSEQKNLVKKYVKHSKKLRRAGLL